jgi:UDP-N-acetylmuramyl tripeptide synthase
MVLKLKNKIELLFYMTFKKTLNTVFKREGDVLPAHILKKFDKGLFNDFASDLAAYHLPTIIITGTNGKTTTANLIFSGLSKSGKKICFNGNGANMPNGIFGSIIGSYSLKGKFIPEVILIEADEKVFPDIVSKIKPDTVVITNFFRDQLDRYGEVNTTMLNIKNSIKNIIPLPVLILPSDEPLGSFIGYGLNNPKIYYGFKYANKEIGKKKAGAFLNYFNIIGDAITCPNCGSILTCEKNNAYFMSLKYYCKLCGYKNSPPDVEAVKSEHRSIMDNYVPCKNSSADIEADKPEYEYKPVINNHFLNNGNKIDIENLKPNDEVNKSAAGRIRFKIKNSNKTFEFKPVLSGEYNIYNYMAAFCVLKHYNVNDEIIKLAFERYVTKFGRSYKKVINGITINIDLVKNPSGFNSVLEKITAENSFINALFAFSDRDADGKDVSWIWDVNFEKFIKKFNKVIITGLRPYDMAIRLKTAGLKSDNIFVIHGVKKAFTKILKLTSVDNKLDNVKEKISNGALDNADINYNLPSNLDFGAAKNSDVSTVCNSNIFILPTYTELLRLKKYIQ